MAVLSVNSYRVDGKALNISNKSLFWAMKQSRGGEKA
jgi:hypothetical protein